jgi:dTDP-D-glucose 4,6-dehydratase
MMLTPGKVNELYHADWAAHEMLLDHHSDWRPQINFETGFHQTADWYRAQGWLPGSPRAGTSQPVRKHGETAR